MFDIPVVEFPPLVRRPRRWLHQKAARAQERLALALAHQEALDMPSVCPCFFLCRLKRSRGMLPDDDNRPSTVDVKNPAPLCGPARPTFYPAGFRHFYER